MKYHNYLILSILFLGIAITLPGCRVDLSPNNLSEDALVFPPILKGERSSQSISLFWNWVTYELVGLEKYVEPDRFQILMKEENATEWTLIAEVESNVSYYLVEELENGENYHFRIEALINSGSSAVSNEIMITPQGAEDLDLIFPDNNYHRYWGSWANNGQSIVYESVIPSNSNDLDTLRGVYTFNINTQTEQLLSQGTSPDWSPDGTKIAFHSQTGFASSPASGGNPELIFYETANETFSSLPIPGDLNHQVSWAPNNISFAYLSNQANSSAFSIYQGGIANSSPSRVVFTANALSFDTSSNIDLPLFAPQTPSWDITGEKIIFSQIILIGSESGYLRQIHEISPETQLEERVIPSNWNDELPTYSPSGEYLAFVSDRSGEKAIWLYHLATQSFRQLTTTYRIIPETQKGKLEWAPDEQSILFTAPYENTGYLTLYKVYL